MTRSVQEIFDTEPLEYTDEDFLTLHEYFRKQRESFVLEETKKRAAPKKEKGKKIDLSQIKLDI